MSLQMNTALATLQPSGIRCITARAKRKPGCILLTLGEPDGNTAEAVKAQVAASLADNETHYPPNNGTDALREAIAGHMAGRGLAYSAGNIVVTAGATEALFAALSAVMNPGDEVLVPTPAFGLYESIVTVNRGVYLPVDTRATQFQLTDELLNEYASACTKAIVITSPNNPTGCVLSDESYEAVARFARERDVFVICDDVYASLVYEPGLVGADGTHHGFATRYPDLADRIIVCDSFSKPYAMTGWRLGWVAASDEVTAQIVKMHQYMVSSVPSFVQRAACEALQQDVAPARAVYAARRETVLAALADMGLPVVEPAGAFYAFPSIEEFGISSEEFCLRLIDEAGVALVPGTCFGAEGYVRLSYCCSEEAIAQGLARLGSFVEKLRA